MPWFEKKEALISMQPDSIVRAQQVAHTKD
jgi:hypothetical protein